MFDKVVIVCKRKGYSYEQKDILELLCYKMTDDPTNNKDIKKVSGAGPPFPSLIANVGHCKGGGGESSSRWKHIWCLPGGQPCLMVLQGAVEGLPPKSRGAQAAQGLEAVDFPILH